MTKPIASLPILLYLHACHVIKLIPLLWEQFKYPASVKWGSPRVAPWQVRGSYTRIWKQESSWVWGCMDQEQKLQNEGSRRSLSFSTYLNITAELAAVSKTFPERPTPASGAFRGTSPTSTHASVSEASFQLQCSSQKQQRFSSFKENFFCIQTQSEHTHFNWNRFTCASIKLTRKP